MEGSAVSKTWSSGSSESMPFCGDLTPTATTRSSSPQPYTYGCRPGALEGPGSVALLGRHLVGEYLAANSAVKVKNTFIDGFKEDEEDEGPPMMHIRTCPDRMRFPMKVTLTTDRLTEEYDWGLCGLPEVAQPPLEAQPPLQEATMAQGPPLSGHGLEADRQPEWSLGAAQHDGNGSCRPCAWFWKPQGCVNGVDCGHCHLCPKGELKARKKTKVKTMRGQGA